MYTLSQITELGNYYLEDMKKRGRHFNPIRFELSTGRAAGTFGTAYNSYARLGYDLIKINPSIIEKNDLINTIIHELSHSDLEAYNDGHGYSWKRVAALYSRWYGTDIKRTGHKALDIPGSVVATVTWTEKCLAKNPQFRDGKPYVRVFSTANRATAFKEKYSKIGFINTIDIKPASK